MMTNLKSCPFCGGIGVHGPTHEEEWDIHIMMCSHCLAQACGDTPDLAITAWNTRAPEEAQATEIARLKAEKHEMTMQGLWGRTDAGNEIVRLKTLIETLMPQVVVADKMWDEQVDKCDGLERQLTDAQTEIAQLTLERDKALADADRLKTAITRQAAAVRSLHANEETEVNTLRAKVNAAHLAVVTLDSEREANAILTAEVAKLTARLDEAVGVIRLWERYDTSDMSDVDCMLAYADAISANRAALAKQEPSQ